MLLTKVVDIITKINTFYDYLFLNGYIWSNLNQSDYILIFFSEIKRV